MRKELPWHERRIVYEVSDMGNVSVQRDLTYKSVRETGLKLDVYTPAGLLSDTRLPGVVFIHGGPIPSELQAPPTSWGQYLSWGELIAASGLVGVTFNHRYDDYVHAEQASDDVIAAVNYVREHADAFHLNPDHLCLWTCSGGGPFLSFALRDQPKYVRCIVIYYAILDLRSLERFSQALSNESLERFSPVTYLGSGASLGFPIFIVRSGLDDPELNQTIDLFIREALAANVALDLVNHPQGRHAFDILDDDARSRQIIARTIEFIKVNV